MTDAYRILHLEDNALDAELVGARLALDGVPADIQVVRTAEQFQAALQAGGLDVILADYQLPGFDGLAALVQVQQHAPQIPFIFVTGEMGEERAITTLREGATDYVLKTRLSRLGTAVQRAIAEARERDARRQAEAAAQREREWLRVTLASIGDAVIATDTQRRVTFLNPVAEALTGWTQLEAVGQPIEAVFPIINESTRRPVENPVDKVLREGRVAGLANHTVLSRRDGLELPIDDSGAPIRDAQGNLIGVALIFRDISTRRSAERALQAAHESAQQAAQRLQQLLAVSAALAQAATPAEVIDVAVRKGLEAARAAAGTAFLLDADGQRLTQAIALNYPAMPVAAFPWVPLDAPLPIAEACRTGAAVWLESRKLLVERYPALDDPRRQSGYEGTAAIPLLGRHGPRGALGFSFAGAHTFEPEERQLLASIAEQCVQALERAELYAEAQQLNQVLDGRVRERTAALEAANAALSKEVSERLRAEQKLEQWREIERGRLAREIHDELGGRITGLKMDLSRAARANNLPPPAQAALELALRDIDALVNAVRRIAQDLRPSVLDDFGLVAALEAHFADFLSRSGLAGTFHTEVAELAVTPEAASASFRIFQEALTNIARHAQATEVTVRLEIQAGHALLRIADNGRGIPAEAMTSTERLGLTGMRERAQLAAGELTIESAAGRGTVILVRIPRLTTE
jgi:PAS domain S-box-containing protein